MKVATELWLKTLGWLLLAVGLTTSPALMSVGTAVVAAGGLLALHRNGWKFRFSVAGGLALALFSWWVVAGLWTEDSGRWADHLRVALPLLLLPLAAQAGGLPPPKLRPWVLGAFAAVTACVASATLIHYLMNREALDLAVLNSKPIPIKTLTSSLSHIYFGVMAAFAATYAFWQALNSTAGWRRWAWAGLGLFLAVCLHVFSIRTGLASFYASAGLLLARLTLQRTGFRLWGALALAGLLLAPAVAYWGSASFRNRIHNTERDLTAWRGGEDLSHWSAARRFVAWELAWELGAQAPLTGVGPGDVHDALYAGYDRKTYTIAQEHRITDPHNQYLSWWAGGGLVGLLLGLALLLSPLHPRCRPLHPAFWCLGGAILAGFCFESMSERQAGITFWIWGWALLGNFAREEADGGD